MTTNNYLDATSKPVLLILDYKHSMLFTINLHLNLYISKTKKHKKISNTAKLHYNTHPICFGDMDFFEFIVILMG
ncbi:MAG: hypothetical protein ACJAWT_001297 [Glaciecola sp.]|jgi:hypothetical protein